MIKSNFSITIPSSASDFIMKSLRVLGNPKTSVIMLVYSRLDSPAPNPPRFLIGEGGAEVLGLERHIELDGTRVYVQDFAADNMTGKTLMVRAEKSKNDRGVEYDDEYLSVL